MVQSSGWWKGKLNGKIGVFPSNFVQVETSTPPKTTINTQQQVNLQNSLASGLQAPPLANKLNIFNNNNKTSTGRTDSPANNIVESNGNGTANTYVNNNNSSNNTSAGNSMNSSQFQDTTGRVGHGSLPTDGSDTVSNSSNSDKKPTRGPQLGDMFKSKQPSPATSEQPNSVVSNTIDRFNATGSTLQKQIPKKPPPPTPKMVSADIGGPASLTPSLRDDSLFSNDQAPALPPKPINQYNPSLGSRPIQAHSYQHQHHHQQAVAGSVAATLADASLAQQHQATTREFARVIYAYKPSNEDELAIEVGDIIRVIDKEIEDAGWWKGELKGNIGVFPDNFVQLIDPNTIDQEFHRPQPQLPQQQHSHSHQHPWPNGSSNVQSGQNIPKYIMNNPTAENVAELKAPKPVFAGQLKGFSKELESSLDKHNNNPVSFLSLKRNKSQQNAAPEPMECSSITDDRNNHHQQQQVTTSEPENDINSPAKLNHITVNRAKGPSRKPPSNRRGPSDQSGKPDSRSSKDASPVNQQQVPCLPVEKPQQQVESDTVKVPQDGPRATASGSGSVPLDRSNIGGERPRSLAKNSVTDTPEQQLGQTNLKFEEALTNQLAASKSSGQRQTLWTSTPTEAPKTTSTPPWMVELKKAHAGKKRDTPPINSSQPNTITGQDDNAATNTTSLNMTPATVTTPIASTPTISTINSTPIAMSVRKKKSGEQLQTTAPVTEIPQQPQEATKIVNSPPSGAVRSLSTRYSGDFTSTAPATNATPTTTATTDKTDQSQQKVNTTDDIKVINSNGSSLPATITTSSSSQNPIPAIESKSSHIEKHESAIVDSNPTVGPVDGHKESNSDSYQRHQDETLKRFSLKIQIELDSFRQEIKEMKQDLGTVAELKAVVEVMKCELRDCKSAIESQKRYMKDLLNNLADERKKIASMQVEIDRTLK